MFIETYETKTKPIKRNYYDVSKYDICYIDKSYNFDIVGLDILGSCDDSLTKSISGIQNLKITYLNDIVTTSQLDMLIIKIQNRCKKIKNITTLRN